MKAIGGLPLLATTLLALAACNGGTETTPTTNSGATSAGATGGGSGGSGSSGSASTGAGGGAGDTVTLTMSTFTVPPGAEVYYCQNFANPFGGVDTDVSAFESHMTSGSHHLLLFYKKGAVD